MDTSTIMEYKPLIFNLSKKFYGVPKEDLIQAGFLGLIKAHKNYDKSLGYKFSTYAYEYIYGEMYETANSSKPSRVRKDAMRLYKSVIKAQELLTQKYGRAVSYEETAKYLGIDINQFNDILNILSASISVENTELNISREDHIDDLILLKECLEKLSTVEKNVIKNRFVNDMSQTETAKVLGLTQVNVSRIEKRSRDKIKRFVNS